MSSSVPRKKMMLLVVCAALLGFEILSHPDATAQNGTGNIDMKTFTLESRIMAVFPEKSFLIVAERSIKVIQNEVGDKLETELIDAQGNAASLSDFKEGQLVLIQGREDEKGERVAVLVQMIGTSTIKKLPSIKPLKPLE